MRQLLECTLLVTLASTQGLAQRPARPTPSRVAATDSAVTAYMRLRHLPGASVAVALNGSVVFARGYGLADLENQVKVDTLTVFPTASVLKTITAVAVARLAEQGKLDLGAPIQRYCPDYPAKQWTVTARDLLTHQAGVRGSSGADVWNREHYVSPRAALVRFSTDSLRFEPGTSVQYSNAGYNLLACAIEGASGRAFDAYLHEAVLDPAGLRRTVPDDVYRIIPHRARSYIVRTADNTKQWAGLWTAAHLASTRLDEPANADPIDPSWAPGAGGYRSSPADLARYAIAYLDHRLVSDSMTTYLLAEARKRDGTGTGRAHGDWVLQAADGMQTAEVLGSDWSGSMGLVLVPGRRLAIAIGTNVGFEQPQALADELRKIWGA